MNEDWVPVDGFPGYSVHPLGHVRRDGNRRLLRPRFNQYDVPYVGLMREWKQHIRSLARLVALAFVPSPANHFDTPINLDGNRGNCQVDNLMWRPRWYAVRYNNQFKEPYENPILAPVVSLSDAKVFDNSLMAACHYGLLEREVVLSVLNKTYAVPTFQLFELANG